MRRALNLLLLWIFWVVFSSGCLATFKTAEVLPPNTWEGGLALTTTEGRWKSYSERARAKTRALPADLAIPTLWLRRGIWDFMDLGFRTYGLGLAPDIKFQLLKEDIFIPAAALDVGIGIYFVGMSGEASAILSKNIGPLTLYSGYKGVQTRSPSLTPQVFNLHGPFGGLKLKVSPNSWVSMEANYFQNASNSILIDDKGNLLVGSGSAYLGEDGLYLGVAVSSWDAFEGIK